MQLDRSRNPGETSPDRGDTADEHELRRRARAELGIEKLGDDEELIDVATFSDLQARLMVRGTAGAEAPASPPDAEDVLLLEELVCELPPDRPRKEVPVGRLVPPTDPAEVVSLERALRSAVDREQVTEAAVRLALAHARSCGLLAVSQGMIAGLRGAGEDLESRIEGVAISSDAASIFTGPALAGEPFLGRPPASGVGARILRAMGRAEAVEVLILPICIRKRVVNLLYADNGPLPMGRTSVAALDALAGLVAAAYEGIILARKSLEKI